jgi:cellulose synthase/poly-beta-1,6-N-acetylglucosamine synthase-like glycosyltransferase
MRTPRRRTPKGTRSTRDTAERVLSPGQWWAPIILMAGVVASLLFAWLGWLPSQYFGPRAVVIAAIATVTIAYLAVMTLKSVLAFISPHQPDQSAVARVDDGALPTYTILVPLYREAAILAPLIFNLGKLDYPVERLQVLLLVEEDDEETRGALATFDLAGHFEPIVVPHSHPRTKPKACNLGLERATGDYCVIFDAEDRPEPDQLRKAVAAFSAAPRDLVCVQAQLQYWNVTTNWLTRLFAGEYASYFSLLLGGLTRIGGPVPLGGTSNHFPTYALRQLGGWDAFNVTEDADLGIWIARRGGRVALISSVTWEEANSRVGNWVRQRSRWVKGYVQTYLVHMRSPLRLLRELGLRRFLIFQVIVGGTPLTLLVNPIVWGLTLAYIVGPREAIATLFPLTIFYLGVAAMLGGNFLFLYTQMAGCMERGLYSSIGWTLALPVYWVLMSASAYKAVAQLLLPHRRHHWEKTVHGLVPQAAERSVAGDHRDSRQSVSPAR